MAIEVQMRAGEVQETQETKEMSGTVCVIDILSVVEGQLQLIMLQWRSWGILL